MILIYDTETGGLPKDRLPDDHPSQPHLVQLAALLMDHDGTERGSFSVIIHPEGYAIPKEASDVHGITTETAMRCGIPLSVALALFSNFRRRAVLYGGHNVDFDDRIIRIACKRLGKDLPVVDGLKRFCTKEMSTSVINLPPTAKMVAAGFNKPKPPNLAECIKFFFDEELVGAHDAMVDVRACARVYLALTSRGSA